MVVPGETVTAVSPMQFREELHPGAGGCVRLNTKMLMRFCSLMSVL